MALTNLRFLQPGTRFRLAGMPDVKGELLDCSDCSAKVRIDGGVRDVEIENADGTTRTFTARRTHTTTWAPTTLVEPILQPEHEETDDMPATKTKKTKTPKATKTTKAPKAKAAKEPAAKKLSALDAAAQVLAGAKEPMSSQELIEAMASRGLWESPGGKTPHATLYAAIIREIGAKGKDARFAKAERGRFTRA